MRPAPIEAVGELSLEADQPHAGASRTDGARSDDVPIVVDLDGTLLKSDLLVESMVHWLRSGQPPLIPLGWLRKGKASLKHGLASSFDVDAAHLPYDERLLAWLRSEHARGRRIVLATASHKKLADAVASHLGVFDRVMATTSAVNLRAAAKRDALVAEYGSKGFDYVGNSADDLVVWRDARLAHLVDATASVARRAALQGNLGQTWPIRRLGWRDRLKALRAHQWLKNLLIFAPLLASHRVHELNLWLQAGLAICVFSAFASSLYLINDVLDAPEDRHHPTKRHRMVASGRLTIAQALLIATAAIAGAATIAALMLPKGFLAGMLAYTAATLAYSIVLKRKVVVDVMMLAFLYTLRVILGGVVTGIPLSFWLLLLSTFIFLSLALAKRHAELVRLAREGWSRTVRGRGYEPGDAALVASLGTSAGYMAVLVLALYINDPATTQLYRHPEWIWAACPMLLMWITRLWLMSHRGRLHEDPVIFAMRDRVSLITAGAIAFVAWMAV